MSSGYGLSGGEFLPEKAMTMNFRANGLVKSCMVKADECQGPSRCFPFWQELLACYVVNTNTDDVSGAKKCLPALEDYYECLHHKKEVSVPALLGKSTKHSCPMIGDGDGSRLILI